jgi:radical SAM superfamily enzyme YgiQ (UPF0313 family)
MQAVTLILAPFFWTQLPPLGLAYIARSLKKDNIPVIMRDLNAEIYDAVSKDLRQRWSSPHEEKNCADLFDAVSHELGISFDTMVETLVMAPSRIFAFSVFRSNKTFSLSLAQIIKQKRKESIIVFGGPEMVNAIDYTTCNIAYAFRDIVDTVVVGEGESAMRMICGDIARKKLQKVYTAKEEKELDRISYPTYDEFDLSVYSRKKAFPILMSRGCIRACTFCSERLLSKRFRTRSAQNVVDEIAYHTERYGVRWFTFHDSLVNGDLGELERMCRLLIERGLDVRWEAQVAIRQDMGTDLISLMKQAGCFNFFVGLESGSDTVLSRMHKGYTADTAAAFFKRAVTAGMHFEISLIVGFIGETEDEFSETIQFLLEHQRVIPKIAQLNPFVVLPETQLACEQSKERNAFPYVYDRENAFRRMRRAQDFFEEHGFLFTPHFINNLSAVYD